MPGLRRLLEEELPDVQDALRDAGASRYDLLHPLPPSMTDTAPRAIDDQLWTYTARRPVGEWVFRRVAERERNIAIRRGVRVVELIGGASAHRRGRRMWRACVPTMEKSFGPIW